MFETLFEKIEENDEEEYVKNEAVFKETEVISSNDGTRYEIFLKHRSRKLCA